MGIPTTVGKRRKVAVAEGSGTWVGSMSVKVPGAGLVGSAVGTALGLAVEVGLGVGG
jgi:hypothetical protein